ncbi:hypothetical protein KSS87_006703 [Heliosperma pusillum]|nr:hypothetical protein KSS87_006703 [Heliosperma pusillum]
MMSICIHQPSVKFANFSTQKVRGSLEPKGKVTTISTISIARSVSYRGKSTIVSMSSVATDAANYISAAPILVPEGPWQQIPGGVTAANGFKATGIYGGLRALGEKPDLALVTCDVDAVSAGAFTTNVVAAAPVVYCKKALDQSQTARAVLINAGQANAATGDAGYQDVLECASALAEIPALKQVPFLQILHLRPEEILIESTGVIGHRIKKKPLIDSLPKLVRSLSSTIEGYVVMNLVIVSSHAQTSNCLKAFICIVTLKFLSSNSLSVIIRVLKLTQNTYRADSAAVAITTTDLVKKSVAIESKAS